MTPPTASAAVIKATQRLNCFYRRKSTGDGRRNSAGGGRRKSHGESGRRRSSVESTNKVYCLVSDSEVTPGSIEVWSDLPEEIKNDPSLAPFRNQYEKQHGISTANTTASTDTQLDLTATDYHEDAGGTAHSQPAPGGANGDVEWNRQDANKGKNDTASVLSQGGDRTIFGKSRVSFLKSNIVGEAGGTLGNVSSKATVPPPHNAHPPNSTTVVALPHQPNLPHHDTSGQDDNTDAVTGHKKMAPWIKNTKIGVLLMCWILFTTILMMKNEKVSITRQLSIPVNRTKNFLILEMPQEQKLSIQLQGPFLPRQYGNLTVDWLTVWLELVESDHPIVAENISLLHAGDVEFKKNLSDVWYIPLVSDEMVDFVPEVTRKKSFVLEDFVPSNETNTLLRVKLKSTLGVITPALISYSVRPIDIKDGILYAACVLAGLYVLIIFEFVHRTFAAILASTMSVAILAILDERPSTQELISWIDVETLLLLFSMMVLVAILSETGIFDYLAVYAYKVTGGRVWPLINYLCFFTAIMSSFLDNVTTVLLMTPVTIRLCEVMELNPVPILMAMIIYSNVGGTLTPVGDPPNVIIASNSQIIKAGIDFTTFTMHMSIGILLVAVQTYIHLRLHFRNMDDLRHSEPPQVQELRHEISIWQRAAASLSSYSKDEDLVRETLLKKVNRLMGQLKKKLKEGGSTARYRDNLEQLIQKYPIRNRVLLVKSAVAVLFVIIVFFLHSIPELQRLSLGWTALLGAILLLILADREDMEAVLARVEWSTLLFFAALFILMEALSKLGLIDWIGKMTERVILSAPEDSRLAVAILLILWVSAVASAFVDNIPLTTMMIRIATSLGNNPELNLPLQPLVWALAFGACLGGNGTLIGASANVVCAGVAEQHGYRFTFMEYFRVGFPLMIGSITVISGYLLVCHVVLEWH